MFLDRMDVLDVAGHGATFLLNSPFGPDEVWDKLPRPVQEQIVTKKLKLYVIDAASVAREAGMGGRINTVMQTCFFALAGVLPRDEAIAAIKKAIAKTYGKRGPEVVAKNHAAVDAALSHLFEVRVPGEVTSTQPRRPAVPAGAPDFVKRVTSLMLIGEGDRLPVSAIPADGTWPTATSRWEKRDVALEIPVWDESACIQCGKCVLVCPHAVIRAKVCPPAALAGAPEGFASSPARWADWRDDRYVLKVSPEDCTGCRLCVELCPAKSKKDPAHKALRMEAIEPLRQRAKEEWAFFETLPKADRHHLRPDSVKDVQLMQPLFEFSGACAGCGETPYLKLLSQLYGDRLLVANATGCSSIFGGNLPTTPWATNDDGRGPAWSNSLFEDNAEFGLGIRLAVDKQAAYAKALLTKLEAVVGADLVRDVLNANQSSEQGVQEQRARVAKLRTKLAGRNEPEARDLSAVADTLVRRSTWIVGGDGWAYDIGFGGVDHVLASGENVKLLVLDTEVYSNTGGQASKSTPRGAVARFAAAGKRAPKKDLALMAMTYGNAYVARVALCGNDVQALTALREAEAFDGPALVIAYSHCIAHGYDLAHAVEHQKAAVQSGYWPLLRFNPELKKQGKNPMTLDSRPPSLSLRQLASAETRFTMLAQADPAAADELMREAEEDLKQRWRAYENLAAAPVGNGKETAP
jgi:pyruvate-ferredoxin/flavodoxin oxidoreductase